ncbi:MAG: hypothetical protein ACYDA3_08560 [Gaiellaceae bacterium]
MRRMVIGAAAIALIAAAGVLARALTPPDPLLQATADGCERNDTTLHTLQSPNWVYVNDKDAPASAAPPPLQTVSGTVQRSAQDVHVSGGDNPVTHASYDLNFNIDPSVGQSDLVARTNTSGGLHIERESAASPAFFWPEPGDVVVLKGFWVWDCDHFTTNAEISGEETELHPFTAAWVERAVSPRSKTGEREADLFLTTDKTRAGVNADCAHRTKHDQTAFKACVTSAPDYVDMSGSYSFPLPAAGRVRVVDAGSVNAPPVTVAGGALRFTIPPDGKRHIVAKEVFVAARTAPVEHLRVSFDSVLIRRSMDPGCIPAKTPPCGSVETTLQDQVTRGPTGEWNFYSDVAGVWSLWKPYVWNVRDGQRIRPRKSVDVYIPRGKPFRIFLWTRECDWGTLALGGDGALFPCPKQGEAGARAGDDVPGAALVAFRSPAAAIGTRTVNAGLAGSTCPAVNVNGCYAVTLTIRRVGG